MEPLIKTAEKTARATLHQMEAAFAKIERNTEERYQKIEKSLPAPVARAVAHVTQNPTHMTGFLFLVGDILMGLAGFFSKGKDTEHRNHLKMLSSGFGILNSLTWMNANDLDPAKRADRVIASVD